MMRVGVGVLLALCCLNIAAGCRQESGDDSGSGGSGNTSGSVGLTGGGSGLSDTGGVAGGIGGEPSGSSGGTGGGAAGGPTWPDWAGICVSMRAQLGCLCYSLECVTCVYGTDEEIQQTWVVCSDTEENYREYCSSCGAVSGCPLCRQEWLTSGGTGGSGTGGSGTGGSGTGSMPAWVSSCAESRQRNGTEACQSCGGHCLVCVYGTDAEIEQYGVVCNDTEDNYRRYCSCFAATDCPLCREEWQ